MPYAIILIGLVAIAAVVAGLVMLYSTNLPLTIIISGCLVFKGCRNILKDNS